MTPEAQQKILQVVYRFMDALAYAMGAEGMTFEEFIQSFRANLRNPAMPWLPVLALGWAKSIIPGGMDSSIPLEKLDEMLSQIDTKEKAEALLLSLPEPDAASLESTLKSVKDELPRLRQAFLPVVQRLPHYQRGGRPVELPDPEVRQKIREEIKQLRGPGVKLGDIFERLRNRYDVSSTTIKRIWLEGKENTSSNEELDD